MSGHREEKVFKVTDHRWSGITSMVICVLTLVKIHALTISTLDYVCSLLTPLTWRVAPPHVPCYGE